MSTKVTPRWLEWAREIQSLSQSGYHYAENEYQRERYHRLLDIAAEMVSQYTGIDQDNMMQIFANQKGYATPKVDVRGAVFRDGKLLMVRERIDGGWTMPGGWADVGDIPSEAVAREVKEEAGFGVKACKIIGVYDANRIGPLELFHAFKIVFFCELVDGVARPSNETSEVAFFGPGELPKRLSGERTKHHHIMDAFAFLEDPSRQTVFD